VVGAEPKALPLSLSDGTQLLVHPRYVFCHESCITQTNCDFVVTSVDIERVFSKGRLVLSHIRNRMSVQSTRAVMCLGAWSRMGLVKDQDVMDIVRLPEVKESEDYLEDDWDAIL